MRIRARRVHAFPFNSQFRFAHSPAPPYRTLVYRVYPDIRLPHSLSSIRVLIPLDHFSIPHLPGACQGSPSY